MDEVAKKKSKKEKDKDSKLEKALKVSSELCVSIYHPVSFLVLILRMKFKVSVLLTKSYKIPRG